MSGLKIVLQQAVVSLCKNAETGKACAYLPASPPHSRRGGLDTFFLTKRYPKSQDKTILPPTGQLPARRFVGPAPSMASNYHHKGPELIKHCNRRIHAMQAGIRMLGVKKNEKAALQKTIIEQWAKQGGEVLNKRSNKHHSFTRLRLADEPFCRF